MEVYQQIRPPYLPLAIQGAQAPFLVAVHPLAESEQGCERMEDDVRITFLIPIRAALRGAFPLNGTYFQVSIPKLVGDPIHLSIVESKLLLSTYTTKRTLYSRQTSLRVFSWHFSRTF
jgi:hypothetical protein